MLFSLGKVVFAVAVMAGLALVLYGFGVTSLGVGLVPFAALSAAYQVLGVEHERLCARIRNLNKALAWSAARWAVDQAVAAGTTVIYLEDLATLEARGRRGNANTRLSGQIRGQIVEAIRHLAAKHAIAVVTVPARGTSRYCPRCGDGTSVLKHCPAPDRQHATEPRTAPPQNGPPAPQPTHETTR
ncbi:hypothetical protein [Nonomuraea sp. NPDC049028]|uniref:hypothetical protein n=1 Tax=Nonomuraea sp. NPDC049028 TaxID=3364348 RepID=UPI0037186FD5